jgi:hypothetical protein
MPLKPVSSACLAAAQLRAGRISTADKPRDARALFTSAPTPATSPSDGCLGDGDGAGDGEGDGEHLGIPGMLGTLGIPGIGIEGIHGNGMGNGNGMGRGNGKDTDGGTGCMMTGGFCFSGAGDGTSFVSRPQAKNTDSEMREMASFFIISSPRRLRGRALR